MVAFVDFLGQAPRHDDGVPASSSGPRAHAATGPKVASKRLESQMETRSIWAKTGVWRKPMDLILAIIAKKTSKQPMGKKIQVKVDHGCCQANLDKFYSSATSNRFTPVDLETLPIFTCFTGPNGARRKM